jgi:hypothetical protein
MTVWRSGWRSHAQTALVFRQLRTEKLTGEEIGKRIEAES